MVKKNLSTEQSYEIIQSDKLFFNGGKRPFLTDGQQGKKEQSFILCDSFSKDDETGLSINGAKLRNKAISVNSLR